jgi:DUF1680 family protein
MPRSEYPRPQFRREEWTNLNGEEPTVRLEPDLLGCVDVLQAEAQLDAPDDGWEKRLYRTVHPREGDAQTSATVTAVPYYAWANREPGTMRIWGSGTDDLSRATGAQSGVPLRWLLAVG